ncbi:hypothetical protein C1H46_012592 [Malus baccata]|uniref:Uncharacterized protein n=1 Tax=Malus baccata TaxID=106549 RepID=A0A540MSM9_MALBA|nr:hypothetical protein C1H46_012592 [Malus baccata]
MLFLEDRIRVWWCDGATFVTFRRATVDAGLVTCGGPGGSNRSGGGEGASGLGSRRLRVMISLVQWLVNGARMQRCNGRTAYEQVGASVS